MGFHKNLVDSDLHAPSREPVENATVSAISPLTVVKAENLGALKMAVSPYSGGFQPPIGLTVETIGACSTGRIAPIGLIGGVDTSPWITGTLLFASTAGSLVSAGNASTPYIMATVLTQDSSSGVLYKYPTTVNVDDTVSNSWSLWTAKQIKGSLDLKINTSELTTNGDLLTLDSAGAYTRIGIGTSGQALTVQNGSLTWTNITQTAMTTKSDLNYFTSGCQTVRLPIGTSGQALTVQDGSPAWANITQTAMTTRGDITFFNSSCQSVALTAGASGFVLTVSAGVPVWNAAAAAGAEAYSLQTASYTVLITDNVIEVDTVTASAEFTLFLPSLSPSRRITIKPRTVAGVIKVITTATTITIDRTQTYEFSVPDEATTFFSDGSQNWVIL